jgi:hypothetical protein
MRHDYHYRDAIMIFVVHPPIKQTNASKSGNSCSMPGKHQGRE